MWIPMRAICGLALVALAGCQAALVPPRDPQVCWRLGEAMNGKPDFKPFATNVETLENCAVLLEGVHLTNGEPMIGAYQGRIIYVTDQDTTAAADSRSQRYRVFNPDQRAKIDAGFKALKARGADGR